MFTGFPEETIQFFLDLRFHNNTAWFHEQHDRYVQVVQTPFYELINDLAPTLRKIDPLMEIRPHKCIARIHRDTRFSNDKSPYRDHLWVLFRRAGEPREGSVFYWFEFGPQRLNWGLGTWGENRPMMDRFRRQIVAAPMEILSVIDLCRLPERKLTMGGRFWKKIDFPPSVPLVLKPWYTAREFYISRDNARMSWAGDGDLVQRIARDYRAMAPIYRMMRGIQDDLISEAMPENPAGYHDDF